jgi:diadenosine tetraphosphatase ApaH/serine/threonine PP2A family protein phosphatase
MADIRSKGIQSIYCLGDVVGYGPNPRECLDVVTKLDLCILGNHDQAVLFDPDGFNPVALRAIYWTREELESGPGGARVINERWDFLGGLPRVHVEQTTTYLHGSPRDPTNEYVFPEDIYNQRKMDTLFGRLEQFSFQGHTHIPGVFTETLEFLTPEDCDFKYHLGQEKAMVNVGSVGQPRDGDSRSCYVIYDDEEKVVSFHRVEYPVDITAGKIYEIPELDNMLGDRLKEGH